MKITEIPETRHRTVRERDASGNKISRQVAYKAYRHVNAVGNGKRFLHFLIDYVFQWALLYLPVSLITIGGDYVLGTFFSLFTNTGPSILLFVGYYIICESLFQRTPGKFVTRTIVIDEYGKKPEAAKILLRSIIRLVPFEAFSCFSERGWHDKWSDTWVVTMDEYNELQRLLKEHEGEIVQSEVLPADLTEKRGSNRTALVVIVLAALALAGIIFAIRYQMNEAFEQAKSGGKISGPSSVTLSQSFEMSTRTGKKKVLVLELQNFKYNPLTDKDFFDKKSKEYLDTANAAFYGKFDELRVELKNSLFNSSKTFTGLKNYALGVQDSTAK